MENAEAIKFEKSFIDDKFITLEKDTVVLKQQFSKCTIVDFFFVGCPPCEEKRKMFYDLSGKKLNSDYSIILICNGEISTFDNFLKYCRAFPPKKNIKFVYDYSNSIKRRFNNLNQYPYEIIFDKFNEAATFSGFNSESYSLNIEERIKLINQITNEKSK